MTSKEDVRAAIYSGKEVKRLDAKFNPTPTETSE